MCGCYACYRILFVVILSLVYNILHISMSKNLHRFYLSFLVVIVLFTFTGVLIYGGSYYSTNLQNRFYHELNEILRPSGFYGHGMGVIGSSAIIIGVFGYMARKRMRFLMRLGVLKYWLEFHIFLCSLGPVLILFHTAFKFSGIVAISFWSMVAVVISGVIGRYIYIQIPRSIEGRELSLNEIGNIKNDVEIEIRERFNLNKDILSQIEEKVKFKRDVSEFSFFRVIISRLAFERKTVSDLRGLLKQNGINRKSRNRLLKLFRAEMVLGRRIEWLGLMQNLLRYWHVLHLPFALIMLVIMIVHVAIAILFGYTWIF